ncbi:hypothetical protein Q4601_07150 [Shewanella sp. 1_MG-2023]|uniref:hypothetical protein n=1 Tax=unclassified Shewanella TaxID=196818 RepID=UPI0026E42975|nr:MULTISPECIES: hypothetical protein [unclassified Shewanella]MDO6612320.1 hypothetical protein [Shewanella sp. 7_MG-2023]MDO6772174.1 hypothetical protein [Shewanella sp. 2_MG-2023]MDO6794080.1 hypothetical protein [Shewanella sp. 1_MG-2023]
MKQLIVFGVLCVSVSGCDLLDDIIHPKPIVPDAKIDSGFKDQARQLGLSDAVINRLCVATKKIDTHCINTVNDNDVREVKIEYSMEQAVINKDNARSYNNSRVVFHLATDDSASKVYFENTRQYIQSDGYSYTWSEPEGYETTSLSLASDSDNPVLLTNVSEIEEVSAEELYETTYSELSNDDYTLVAGAEVMDDITTVLFPSLTYMLTLDESLEPIDNSFAIYTGGHSNILGNFAPVIADAIEEVWF